MLQDISAAIPLGFLLAFLVGPVFFVLLETAAVKGFRAAITFDLGAIAADIIFILIAYFSTNRLLDRLKDDPSLYVFGGMLLVTYGVMSYLKIKRKTIEDTSHHPTVVMSKKNLFGMFAKGFLLNFINIGVLGFWLVVLISAGPSLEMMPNRITVFFASILITYLVVDIFKILLAKKLRKRLTPQLVAKMKKGISGLLIIFGCVLVAKGIFPEKIHEIEEQVEEIVPEYSFGNYFDTTENCRSESAG
ncbi:MAG: LysE family transporter [Leeuwenhoekiella sp.]